MGVATAVAIGGLAVSAASAVSQRNQARSAGRQADRAMDSQAAAQQDQLEFARQQYGDWRDMFRPVAEDLRSMAYEEREPDYAAIGADVGGAFDTSQAINRRQQQRFGLQPGAGAVEEGELRYGLGRATAMVDGRNRARTANRDSQFNRLSSFYAMGSGQGAQAAQMMSAAHAGVADAFGQRAGAYGAQASQYQAGANAALGDAAGWAGWGFGQYMQNRPAGG